jgi:hypothetical protein
VQAGRRVLQGCAAYAAVLCMGMLNLEKTSCS